MACRQQDQAMVPAMEHSQEYYQQMEGDLNIVEFTQRVYGNGSENMLSLVKNSWQRLAIAQNLQKDKKTKLVIYAEDEFELLKKTLYISRETTLPHERYRVQLVIQLAGFTGNRPSALLSVLYQHIEVTLLEDPGGREQPRVLIEIVFHNTKGYLGEKEVYGFPFHIVFVPASDYIAVANGRGRNEFGIPDVPSEPCLLLYPYITTLVLLFAD
ncbi:MAG: hypothetical protein Q9181_000349 [Wetmoreana brouardii]